MFPSLAEVKTAEHVFIGDPPLYFILLYRGINPTDSNYFLGCSPPRYAEVVESLHVAFGAGDLGVGNTFFEKGQAPSQRAGRKTSLTLGLLTPALCGDCKSVPRCLWYRQLGSRLCL